MTLGESLRVLARHLEVPERTLRRAASQGLVHGERLSERRFKTTLREEAYLRRQWPLLSDLRGALRTEPNVRLAVLFGSFATGADAESSDVDLLVVLRDSAPGVVAALAGRLVDRLGRDIQLVRLEEAEQSPGLMLDVLAEGRVLVDRERLWPRVKGRERRWRRQAAAEDAPLEDSMPDLGL